MSTRLESSLNLSSCHGPESSECPETLTSTHVVDMIIQVLNGLVIGNRDPLGEEGVYDRLAADVAKGGAGRREIDQDLNGFGHFDNVAWAAVGSVDELHRDVADRAGADLPRESMKDARDLQATGWSAVESLSSPVLRQSLGDGNVWTVLDPGDDRLRRLIEERGSADSVANLSATGDDGLL